MSQLIIDASLPVKLLKLTEPVELCDHEGKVVGCYTPRFDLSEWEPVSAAASEEELAKRERSKDWLTSEEVFAMLKRLKEGQS